MRGGNRTGRSGPPPDPNAIRRAANRTDNGADWVSLPKSARVDPVPEWPLSDPSDRELILWAREWDRPQGILWVLNDQIVEVAFLVRQMAEAETPFAPAATRTLVRQMMESLGISTPGMLRNRWRIVDDAPDAEEITDAGSEPAEGGGDVVDARDRLQLLAGDG